MSSSTTPELADRYLMQTGRRLPVTFVRGKGCLVYDDSGREYLDLVAGIAVNLLGHAHPDVVAAVTTQANALIHTSNLYFTQPQVELAQRLVELSFPSRVFLCNSGAEANEAAIKLVRKWGTRYRDGAFEIITTTGSFHGRTLATVTAGGQHKYSDPFKPLPGGFVHVPFNDVDAIKSATRNQTVAVMLEPVMGEIGIVPAASGYLAAVREWCNAQDLLLILDEVQTGLGRTGRWFAHQHHGITPDVMTLAKGLGGGVPIGACLAAPRADVFEPGDHGSTFGGNPLACAAAIAVLSVIERDGLVGHAAEMGGVLHDALLDLGAREVRGLGLMQAFEFAEPRAKAFQQTCLDAGLIVNAVDDNSIRLVPPLIIGSAEIDHAHSTMRKAIGGRRPKASATTPSSRWSIVARRIRSKTSPRRSPAAGCARHRRRSPATSRNWG
ncbi:MAG: acetylornithine transaminase [Candidatus Dormibacteraceae bacterium]